MATLVPKKYSEGSFEDAQYQAFGYDDATTNREIRRNDRRFNRYLRSDAGQRMRAQFEADAALAEQQKQQEAKDKVAQLWNAAGGHKGIINTIKSFNTVKTPTLSQTPPTKSEASSEPVLVPKISYWDRVAKQYGFADSNAVRNWQAQNGLVADGKFGNNSRAVWNRLNGVSATPYWDAVARANGFENAAAVATWQAQHGLVADGKIGARTLAVLNAQAAPVPTPTAEAPVGETSVVEVPVEATTPEVPQQTWRSVTVHNAFDATPVRTISVPTTKRQAPTTPVVATTTPVVETSTPVVETNTPDSAGPTWRSVTVHNAFDGTPVTTVHIPSTKKPIPANQWSGGGAAPPLLDAANPEPAKPAGYVPWDMSLYQPRSKTQTQNRNNPPRNVSWQK